MDEFYKGDPKITSRIKSAMVVEAEAEEGFVSMDNVAAQAFEGDIEEKDRYIGVLRDAGVQEDQPLGQRVVKQQFATHKIKGENGVEIRFPAELAVEEDAIEFTTHPDGSISILIKNLRMV